VASAPDLETPVTSHRYPTVHTAVALRTPQADPSATKASRRVLARWWEDLRTRAVDEREVLEDLLEVHYLPWDEFGNGESDDGNGGAGRIASRTAEPTA
jgi:hypothetical protein